MKNKTRLRALEGKRPRAKRLQHIWLEQDVDGVYWDGEPGVPGSHVVPAEEVERMKADTIILVVLRDVEETN